MVALDQGIKVHALAGQELVGPDMVGEWGGWSHELQGGLAAWGSERSIAPIRIHDDMQQAEHGSFPLKRPS